MTTYGTSRQESGAIGQAAVEPKPSAQEARDKRAHELVTLEYKYLTELFIANEEMGEKRVTLFVSLTAGLGAAAVLAYEKLGANSAMSFPGLFILISGAWLLFGYLTFLRIIHRNSTTDKYKRQLRDLRTWFVEQGDSAVLRVLPFNPYESSSDEREGLRLLASQGGKGGYAELVALINSVIAGTLGWQLTYLVFKAGTDRHAWLAAPVSLATAVLVALVAWGWQSRHAAMKYTDN